MENYEDIVMDSEYMYDEFAGNLLFNRSLYETPITRLVDYELFSSSLQCDLFSVRARFSWLKNFTDMMNATDSLAPVLDVDVSAVWTTVVLNCWLFLAMMSLYEVLRRMMPSVYEGRSRHVASERTLPALPQTYNPCAWVYRVARIPWWRVRESAGLDAYMFLRFINMCQRITLASGFWGFIILWPVFGTGGVGAPGWYKFSMANLEQSDWKIWVPTVFMWLFSCFVYYVTNKEFHHYIELRMEFLGKGDRDIHPQHHYSLMIERIPKELRSDKALLDYFRSMFPNKVHSAVVALTLPELDILTYRRARVTRRLEKSIAYLYATGKRPTHVVGQGRIMVAGIESTPFGCCARKGVYTGDFDDIDNFPKRGQRVDSIQYYIVELLDMNSDIIGLQKVKTAIAETGNETAKNWLMRVVDIASSGAAGLIGIEEGEDGAACTFWSLDSCPQPPNCIGAPANPTFSFDEIHTQPKNSTNANSTSTSPKKLHQQKYGSIAKDKNTEVNSINGSDSDEILDSLVVIPSNKEISPKNKRTKFLLNKRKLPNDKRSELSRRTTVTFPGDRDKHHHDSRTVNTMFHVLDIVGYDFFMDFCEMSNMAIDAYVDHIVGSEMSSTGFVTFNDLVSVTYANSVLLTHKPNALFVQVAPEPRGETKAKNTVIDTNLLIARYLFSNLLSVFLVTFVTDFIWKNIHIDINLQKGKERIANILVFLGAVLWSIPLTLIQAVATATSLSRVPGFSWVLTYQGGTLTNFINGYLPVVALLCLITLIPLIFEWVAINYENRKTKSDVQNSILSRYFYYQLANIYVTVTAGSIWDSLADIIDDPSTIASILGKSLPQVVGYFISLIVTKTLAGLPMVLLRLGELGRFSLLRCIFREKKLTQRELDQIYRGREIFYGWEYPTQLLVIVICFTYACISPVILPIGCVYFSAALLVYKKQMLYVYTPAYESGGTMFPSACKYSLYGLALSQVTFLGYAILRHGYYQPIALIPLPFITMQVVKYNKKNFIDPSKTLSLERATELDRRNMIETHHTGGMDSPSSVASTVNVRFSADAYRQPVLTEPPLEPLPYRTGLIDEIQTEIAEMVRNGNIMNRNGLYRRMSDKKVMEIS